MKATGIVLLLVAAALALRTLQGQVAFGQEDCQTFGTPGNFTDAIDLQVDAQGNIYLTLQPEGTLTKLSPEGDLLFSRNESAVTFEQVATDAAGNLYAAVRRRQDPFSFDPVLTFVSPNCQFVNNTAILVLDSETGDCICAFGAENIGDIVGDTVGPNVYFVYESIPLMFPFSNGRLSVGKLAASECELVEDELAGIAITPPAGQELNVYVASNGTVTTIATSIPPRGIPFITQRVIRFTPAGEIMSESFFEAFNRGIIRDYALDVTTGTEFVILAKGQGRIVCGTEYSQEFQAFLATLDCSRVVPLPDPGFDSLILDERNRDIYVYSEIPDFAFITVTNTPFAKYDADTFEFQWLTELNPLRVNDAQLSGGQIFIVGNSPAPPSLGQGGTIRLGPLTFERQGTADAFLATIDPATGEVCNGTTCETDRPDNAICGEFFSGFVCNSLCAFVVCEEGRARQLQTCPIGTVCNFRLLDQGSPCVTDPTAQPPTDYLCTGELRLC